VKGLTTLGVLGVSVAAVASCRPAPQEITQEQLVGRTQELFDAVAPGDLSPWKRYFAEDGLYFDEKGRSMDKAALLRDVTPLPKGYSGAIKIVKAESRIRGDTAILTYDLDETETIFGQKMTARYHGTDTWMRRNGQWQIVAGQMLRYYEDPSPGNIAPKKLAAYTGIYELTPGTTITVTTDGAEVYAQRGNAPRELLIPEATDVFFRPGVEGRRLFRHADDGKVDAMIDRRNNEDLIWKKVK
jgi:hypothetical protein